MNEIAIDFKSCIDSLPEMDIENVHRLYSDAVQKLQSKIVVLDDDPTGTQVVHDIPVITDWSEESIRFGFQSSGSMFFILTNSRGMTEEQTISVHRDIVRNIISVMKQTGQETIIISRSDSTLRGHYPLETEIIRREWESAGNVPFDGEVIMPFFLEGGRYTVHDVHYVKQGSKLVPAANTEFAKDRTFPYSHSDLREWIEEKTSGAYKADDVCSISIDELRSLDIKKISAKLQAVHNFGKIVVNAVDYGDVEAFCAALIDAMNCGKHFIIRSAASITKILGCVQNRPLLSADELEDPSNQNGGLIVVGSHVNKTTMQLQALQKMHPLHSIEFDIQNIFDPKALEEQKKSISRQIDELLANGENVVLYTTRKRMDLDDNNGQAELCLSLDISQALSDTIKMISVIPRFIITKGGITSSDIATKSLGIQKAKVMGQIINGVPVWKAEECQFPGLPLIIFPGNVGDENALNNVFEKMV